MKVLASLKIKNVFTKFSDEYVDDLYNLRLENGRTVFPKYDSAEESEKSIGDTRALKGIEDVNVPNALKKEEKERRRRLARFEGFGRGKMRLCC